MEKRSYMNKENEKGLYDNGLLLKIEDLKLLYYTEDHRGLILIPLGL